ncbi:MAG: sugar ABC transporter permease [Bacilli bacterium]|nr:sugar ABC transporter permease [Bacilli bacterium]
MNKSQVISKDNKARNRRFNTAYLFIGPYAIIFLVFVVLLILISFLLSFAYYDGVNMPHFIGLTNYVTLFTQDLDFMQSALPNTIKYALIVGPVGYMLAFFLAWVLAQLPRRFRNVAAIILYSPSLTGSVLISVVWKAMFSGDSRGYINYLLLSWGIVNEPLQFLQDKTTIFIIMVFVGLWSSMGIGFLAMLSGILNTNREIYEAAYVDGMKNRFQEIIYITIPSMRPQMMFGAVMAIVSTFNSAGLATALTGASPTPQLAGWLISDHMQDYAFSRMEMGYASSLSVVLLMLVLVFYFVANHLFRSDD